MTRLPHPPHLHTPIEYRDTDDADSLLEAFVAPAALLNLNRGAGRVHQSLRDTCTPACTITPARALGCLDCRNNAPGTEVDLHCNTCPAEYTSPCNDKDCGIPRACFDEHCPTECQDKNCELAACCLGEPSVCTTTCHDEDCAFSIADDFCGIDPRLCEQGDCHGLSLCGSGSWLDLCQSHHHSNHFDPLMLTNNTSSWDHAPLSFQKHHSHDHHPNHDTNHKRRRLDVGSSRSSLQSHNSFAPSCEWSGYDMNFGSECGESFFNLESQQNPGQNNLLGTGCHLDQFRHNHVQSENLESDMRAPQALSQLSLATDFASTTSSTCLTSPTDLFKLEVDALFPTTESFASTLVNPVVNDHEQDMASIACGLRLLDEHTSSKVEHDPGCRMAGQSSRLTRQRSLGDDELPLFTSESFNSGSSARRGNLKSAEASTTCQWIISEPQGDEGPLVCDQHFSNSQELDKHVQNEHTNKLGSQQFACRWQGCNASFKHRGKLNRHISGAHSRYHAYQCFHPDCDRTFCTKEQLKNHETTHTGEKKYRCVHCGHKSATKTQHNTHERTHTGEKPYACPFCDHTSGDSSNLSKHVKNKHPDKRGLPIGQARRSLAKHEKAG